MAATAIRGIRLKFQKFTKLARKDYGEVTRFLKERTHLTAREWVIARLCAEFRNDRGQAEMTWIGEHLPELAPFMLEPYSRQEVSNARAAFKDKIRRSGATFFYAYYSGLVDMNEMIDVIHTMVEDIGFLLDVEGDETGEVNTEVQAQVAEVLRRINEALAEED